MCGAGNPNQEPLLNFRMQPNSFGRKLGIGVRVASKMLKERAVASSSSTQNGAGGQRAAAARPTARKSTPAKPPRNYHEPARRIGTGTRRFGEAFFGPVVHTGVTLWLEITGLFFALFALFFAQNVYRLRAAYAAGPEHTHFVLYAVITMLFCYFSFTSFNKARQRSKALRAGQRPGRQTRGKR